MNRTKKFIFVVLVLAINIACLTEPICNITGSC